ncbi:MAG: ABC transporter ATP-binding protein [Dehalococcoidales bacterium]|jgi:iron complex transport system ATP-binding protein
MIELEMRKVSLGYSHHPVVEDINFKAAPGELVGLIGPNGSGKSTIIKALSHLLRPTAGEILVGGRDIAGIPRRELACLVGVVPQLPLLPSTFTAFEIVLMGRNPHLGLFQSEGKRDWDIARDAMEKTGTGPLANRYVNELSGGEIQSLLIARVLVQETSAILLDEPTANLDIGRQIEVLDLIKHLCLENSLTVLAAVHDLNLAAQYCDRLLLINDGHVYAQGTPAEVITDANIKEVYGAEHCVYAHPVNGLPAVLISATRKKT